MTKTRITVLTLEKKMNISNEERKRFMEVFPFSGDTTLQILKGHILAEEKVREVVRLQLPHRQALIGSQGATFDCHQMICLAEAITPESPKQEWLWIALKKLNRLRNYLAHQIEESESLGNKIGDLVSFVRKNDNTYQSLSTKFEESEQLAFCIMSLNTNLAALIQMVKNKRIN
ncbi:hypothetical protein HUO09_05715 [Vibrio sp. Y2-5]|uniref:hypothetical protein n=1 Tax=Vibrio sp. Y2-5 TaxID=2743977 RepID=UPI001660F77C|nr:hypothetical protein [Vibrio sp. Y2-5]MBD0785829.1 hypothetical protein [Vibrio sp. Y2-5]